MIRNLVMKVIRTITLSRILIWTFTAVLAIASVTAYENRTALVAYFTRTQLEVDRKAFTVSQSTKNILTQVVGASEDIVAIGVVSTNIRANQADVVFYFSSDTEFNTLYASHLRETAGVHPLFTSNEPHNALLVKLINGEFVCVPFDTLPLSQTDEELKSTVKFTCMSSIPSYYGYFSGFITFYLKDVPSSAKQEQLKLNIQTIANAIYFRDVLASQGD